MGLADARPQAKKSPERDEDVSEWDSAVRGEEQYDVDANWNTSPGTLAIPVDLEQRTEGLQSGEVS